MSLKKIKVTVVKSAPFEVVLYYPYVIPQPTQVFHTQTNTRVNLIETRTGAKQELQPV